MAKSQHRTEFEPDIPDGLQIKPHHRGTRYIGKRADVLKAGILSAELLPKKFQDFAVIHDGRQIKGGKWGWGKFSRWELFVYHERRTPSLTLIQGGRETAE